MKITKQDGIIVHGHDLEMCNCKIFCTPDNASLTNQHVLCGKYDDMRRTVKVFSEMTAIGWNCKNPEYVMPQR